MEPITGTSLTERLGSFFSGAKTRWQGVSQGAKYCLAMILGAVLMTALVTDPSIHDGNLRKADALRAKATDAETEKLVKANAALRKQLADMGAPRIRVSDFEPEYPVPAWHSGIDIYINKGNEFVFSFSPEAAENFAAGETLATRDVRSALRDPAYRRMLAAPYPQVR